MTFSFDSCRERRPMMCCVLRTCTFFLGWSVCAVLPWFTWPLWTTSCGWCGLHGSSLSHAWKQTVPSSSPIILLRWDVRRFLHINWFFFKVTPKKEMCREALFLHGWNFNNEHFSVFLLSQFIKRRYYFLGLFNFLSAGVSEYALARDFWASSHLHLPHSGFSLRCAHRYKTYRNSNLCTAEPIMRDLSRTLLKCLNLSCH